MKKLLFLLPVLIIPSAVHAALQCFSYLKQSTCSSTINYEVYGDTTGSTASSATCYTEYDATGAIMGRIKYITLITCDTAMGYAPKMVSVDKCVGDTQTHKTIQYYSCECEDVYTWNDNWISYNSYAEYDAGSRVNCGAVSSLRRVRCKAGYYSAAGKAYAIAGNTTSTSMGLAATTLQCTTCEATCGAGHTTSTAGATSYAECRAPAATTFTDGTGTFSYSTACCCDDTCDSKCDSGKSCTSDSDCDSNLCRDGCCKEITTVCPAGSDPCTTVADCPNSRLYTCTDGCCVRGMTPALRCVEGTPAYCTSQADCDLDQMCDLATKCCT